MEEILTWRRSARIQVTQPLQDSYNGLEMSSFDSLEEMLKREFEALGAKLDQEFKALGISIENMLRNAAQSVGSQNALDICSAADSVTTVTTSKSNTNNEISKIATFTGTTASTILPSNPSTKLDSISKNNSNDNNNNSQSFIYEEESCNFDETFLSTEDYDFIDTIQSPTFSGISLPSLFYDSSKYSSLPIPTLSDVYNSASVSSGLTISAQKSVSCQPISGAAELHLLAKDNSNSRLLFYIINMYVIFVLDPGIF